MSKTQKEKGKKVGRAPIYEEAMIQRHFFIRVDQDKKLKELSNGRDKSKLIRDAIDEKFMGTKIKYIS